MTCYHVCAEFESADPQREFCPGRFWIDFRTLDERGKSDLKSDLLAKGARTVVFTDIPEDRVEFLKAFDEVCQIWGDLNDIGSDDPD